MSNLILVLCVTLLVAVPAVPANWTKSIGAPYSGSSWDTLGQQVQGATYFAANLNKTELPGFNLTSGVGGSNITATTISSVLPVGGGTSTRPGQIAGGWSQVYEEVSPNITIQFHNQSGAIKLHAVNVTVAYSYSGNLTFTAGNCPWVKATKKANWCFSEISAAFALLPDEMSRPTGKQGVVGICTQGCAAEDVNLGGFWNLSTNSSKGLSVSKGSVAGGSLAFGGSGIMSMTYTPKAPISASGKWSVLFTAEGSLEPLMECKAGAGGLTGASNSGTLEISITVVSIVEN
jgi:hypothetical protein